MVRLFCDIAEKWLVCQKWSVQVLITWAGVGGWLLRMLGCLGQWRPRGTSPPIQVRVDWKADFYQWRSVRTLWADGLAWRSLSKQPAPGWIHHMPARGARGGPASKSLEKRWDPSVAIWKCSFRKIQTWSSPWATSLPSLIPDESPGYLPTGFALCCMDDVCYTPSVVAANYSWEWVTDALHIVDIIIEIYCCIV